MGCLQICGGLTLVLGIVLLALGGVIPGGMWNAINDGIKAGDHLKTCPGDSLDSFKGVAGDVSTDKDWKGYFDPLSPPDYYDMYLYSIENAEEYINGGTAKVAEVGPFVVQQWCQNFDVAFAGDGQNIEYRNTCVNAFLVEDFSPYAPVKGLGVHTQNLEARSPTDLDQNTAIVNYALGYVGALNGIGTEQVVLFTAAGCTPAQIGNIDPTLDKDTCTEAQLAAGDATCACCALDDVVDMTDYAGVGTNAGQGACATIETEKVNAVMGQCYTGIVAASGGALTMDTVGPYVTAQAGGVGISDLVYCNGVVIQGAAQQGIIDGSGGAIDAATVSAYSQGQAALAGISEADYYQGVLATSFGTANTQQGVIDGLLAALGPLVSCSCADGTSDPTSDFCCLSGGNAAGFEMAGFFCADDGVTTTMRNAYNFATKISTLQGGTERPVKRSCNEFVGESSSAVALVSMLAGFDGGIQVMSSGDDKAREVGTFAATAFGSTSLYTPLIQKHTANDLMFGFPSAILGAMLPMLYLPTIWDELGNATQAAQFNDDYEAYKAATLGGALGANYPGGDQSSYTARFQQACGSTCAVDGSPMDPNSYKCVGYADSRSEIDESLMQFANNDCKPLSWTFSTVYFCAALAQGLQEGVIDQVADGMVSDSTVFPSITTMAEAYTAMGADHDTKYAYALGVIKMQYSIDLYTAYETWDASVEQIEEFVQINLLTPMGAEYCKCADGTDAKAEGFAGCCLSGGSAPGQMPFTGFGCLYEHPAFYGENYGAEDLEAAFVAADAKQSDGIVSQKNMCPTNMEEISAQTTWKGETENQVTAAGFMSPVEGLDGTKWEPQGIPEDLMGESILNPAGNYPAKDGTKLFVSQALMSLPVEFKQDIELVDGVYIHRFGIPDSALKSTASGGQADAAEKNVGTRADGLVDISYHAPNSLPLFLSHPNFMNSDEDLLGAANGIEMYHCWDYGDYRDASTHLDSNGDIDLASCEIMNSAWLTANKDKLGVDLDVVGALGLTISGHKRLMGSIEATNVCDPASDVMCGLAIDLTGRTGSCHSAAAAVTQAAFEANLQGGAEAAAGVSLPDGTGATLLTGALTAFGKEQAAGYPCNNANVFTPKLDGGNVMPLYWADEWKAATAKNIDDLGAAANALGMIGMIGTIFYGLGAVFAVLGLICIAAGNGGAKTAASG